MRIVGRKAFRVVYFYLMTAGLPVLLMHLAMENERLCALAYLCAILLAFPISLLPGKIAKEKIPLRMPVAFAAAGAVIAAAIAFAVHNELFFLRGIFAGIIMALLMIFAVREAALEYGQWTSTQGASIGLVLYLFAGAATASLVEAPLLRELFWIEAVVFLLCTAFYLNTDNMLIGHATRKNARPPKSLVTGNRILTLIFIGIGALVIFQGQLREAAGRFTKWVTLMVLRFVYWIASMLGGGGGSGEGKQEQMDPAQMFEDFGVTEPSAFWVFMEKVFVVVAIVVGIALVVLALVVVTRLLIRAFRFLRAYMARFMEVSGEDYVDEQVDLFDLDDLKEQTKERLQQAVRRFTRRSKKWDDMDTREKVRFSVRQLYSRSGYANGELRSLTIREAADKLPKTDMGEEKLSALYEKARYSQTEPTEQEANELRKAVRS
ncbi:MAG: hypothetical protein IJB41_08340 [Clostridia bacterium]|nr:hypothetical protein [Clostridia bacterium]